MTKNIAANDNRHPDGRTFPAKVSGTYHTYMQHYDAAQNYVRYPRNEHDNIAALLFSTLLLEAYVNHLGEHLLQTWNESQDGNLSIARKLAKLHKTLGLKFNRANNADKQAFKLIKQRNSLVHSKSFDITGNIDEAEDNTHEISLSHTSISRQNNLNPTKQEARIAFESVCRLIAKLDYSAKKQHSDKFTSDQIGPFGKLMELNVE